MEYQINNFLDNHQINHLSSEQKTGLKKMMNQEEIAILILKSNFKLQW